MSLDNAPSRSVNLKIYPIRANEGAAEPIMPAITGVGVRVCKQILVHEVIRNYYCNRHFYFDLIQQRDMIIRRN